VYLQASMTASGSKWVSWRYLYLGRRAVYSCRASRGWFGTEDAGCSRRISVHESEEEEDG
jgi:hypothetical protein